MRGQRFTFSSESFIYIPNSSMGAAKSFPSLSICAACQCDKARILIYGEKSDFGSGDEKN